MTTVVQSIENKIFQRFVVMSDIPVAGLLHSQTAVPRVNTRVVGLDALV